MGMSRIISKFHYCLSYSPNTCIGCSVPKHFKVANKLVYPMSHLDGGHLTIYTPTHTHTTTHTWGLSGTAGRRGATDGEVSWALSVPRFSAINIRFGETCFCDCPQSTTDPLQMDNGDLFQTVPTRRGWLARIPVGASIVPRRANL